MSDKDEQEGFRYIFAGIMSSIRNPRGHDNLPDPIDLCLDHLSVAFPKAERLGYRTRCSFGAKVGRRQAFGLNHRYALSANVYPSRIAVLRWSHNAK